VGAITVACERIDDINTRQEQLDSKLESITDEVDILTMRTAEIDITQKREVQKLDETKFEVGKISETMAYPCKKINPTNENGKHL
jgi:hypothetical protein